MKNQFLFGHGLNGGDAGPKSKCFEADFFSNCALTFSRGGGDDSHFGHVQTGTDLFLVGFTYTGW